MLNRVKSLAGKVYDKMSGASGDGLESGGEVLDFRNRVKRFQSQDASSNQMPHSQQVGSGSVARSSNASTSSSSQLKRAQHTTTSHSVSSSNLTDLKSTSAKASTTKSSSNLSELKSSISEVKSNISEMTAQQSNSVNSFSRSLSKATSSALQQSSSSSATTCSTTASGFGKLAASGFKSMGSLDALKMSSTEDLQQLAIPDVSEELGNLSDGGSALTTSSPHSSQKELKFEEKKVTSSSKTKVVTDKNSYESASGHKSESRKLQSGDVSYEEKMRHSASKSKLEMDGITAEKAAATQEEARQLRAGDVTMREESQKKGAAMKISGEGFSAHKAAMSENQQRQTVTPSGTISQESSRKSSKSGLTITAKGVCTKQSSQATSSQNNVSISGFDDLDLNNTIMEFSSTLSSFVDQLKGLSPEEGLDPPSLLENINSMISKAWSFPEYGHELGSSLCNVLRHNGGLDILLENCRSVDEDLKFSSAKVIEQCLTTENRDYVVDKDLQTVVEVACDFAKTSNSDHTRVGTGILEHLFKHDEESCSDIIKMGGLEAVLNKCQTNDNVTLQHCAGALANLSLYGGEETHKEMMKHKTQLWLFPLAFHEDDNIKYYACLAIAALVANKEIEASVIEHGTLNLVEPFINSHLPEDFANYTGSSSTWTIKKLVKKACSSFK
ncbi:Sterile alpha and TIR motif-containing protein 1 [Armadillidium nasatum]|uniref:Sterile alpha and TIR motif-containing protein 1 n=1 Tax=Armadillidium nasatum TaxID=96803 RepID=A0A5N5TLR6_9CRUS|nr:Sterile alpha and TIR motif-containing protein 1 [Armadillidium nasatum]